MQARLILVVIALCLVAVWYSLDLLAARISNQQAALCLALTTAAAGVTVMLSGYLSGGQLGLPLGGALGGAAFAAFLLPPAAVHCSGLGVGVVGFASLLLVGRFFGELPNSSTLALAVAPLLAWIPEFGGLRTMPPWLRAVSRLALVAIPLALIVASAQRRFTAGSSASAPSGPGDVSAQDYLDYGS